MQFIYLVAAKTTYFFSSSSTFTCCNDFLPTIALEYLCRKFWFHRFAIFGLNKTVFVCSDIRMTSAYFPVQSLELDSGTYTKFFFALESIFRQIYRLLFADLFSSWCEVDCQVVTRSYFWFSPWPFFLRFNSTISGSNSEIPSSKSLISLSNMDCRAKSATLE